MKTKAISIHIPSPCAQNWEEMDHTNNRHFCNSCQHAVTDFSTYSNAEIIKTLANTPNICGRFHQAQLDQLNYRLIAAPAPRNWIKYLGVLAIGSSFLVNEAHAIVPSKPLTVQGLTTEKMLIKPPKKVKKIYGYVLDENKNPLVGVKVSLVHTNLFSLTDKKGRFEFILGPNFNYDNQQLAFKANYFSGTMPINFSRERQTDFYIDVSPMIMGRIAFIKH